MGEGKDYRLDFTTACFFSAVLDVSITLERIFNLKPSLNKLKKFSYKTVCSCLFVSCLAINFPYYFLYKPTLIYASVDGYGLYKFSYSEIGMSQFGKVITFLVYFIRDFLTLLLEIILNVVSLILLKKRMTIKRDIMSMNHKVELAVVEINHENHHNLSNLVTDESPKRSKSNKIDYMSKANKNLTLMVAAMCVLSAIMHMSFINCAVLFSVKLDSTTYNYNYYFFSSFFITFKHFSNFFFFLFFNHLFFEQLKSTITKK